MTDRRLLSRVTASSKETSHDEADTRKATIMSAPDHDELDRLFSLWKEKLWSAQGISASEAASRRDFYRYRITGIDRLDENSLEIHVEFAPNAVYGTEHLPGSKVSIVIPLYSHGEVNAPPGTAHLLTEFIVSGGVNPSNLMGTDAEGNPRVYWDTTE